MQFSELEKWSVASFHEIGWRWPADVIKPLSHALNRRFEVVDRKQHDFAALQLGTLHFDGEMEPRDMRAKTEVKGKLFFSYANDVVYSKIDVRNGAIGIVPDSMPCVAWSSEYPIYQVDSAHALPDYIRLLFRTNVFRGRINGMISGASGRKRVEPAALESIEAPLPPLSVQRRIVARWRDAQEQIAAAKQRVEDLKAKSDAEFLKGLGFAFTPSGKLPKVFAVGWQDFGRWSVSFNQQTCASLNLETGKYPVVSLDSILKTVQYGTSEKANTSGDGTLVVRMNNLVDGGLNLTNIKHVKLSPKETDGLRLREGDILFNRTNSKELVGKCAVFHEPIDCVFASYLIRVRTQLDQADPDFVVHVLNGRIGRQQIDALSRQIIGQANVNSTELRSLRIPLPPLPMQRKLVERVIAARAEIARERAAADQLAQTIAAEVETLILGGQP